MRKLLLTLLINLGFLVIIFSPASVLAVDVIGPACSSKYGTDASDVCQSNKPQSKDSNDIYGADGVLTKAANLIATIVGIAAVIMIIISGFKYITASGDPTNIKSAKDTLMFAVVGIVVAVSARVIILFVVSRL